MSEKRVSKRSVKAAVIVPEVVAEPVELVRDPNKMYSTPSLYQGVIFAFLRSKQLMKGATSRLTVAESYRHKNTTIAVEEIKQGLVSFEAIVEEFEGKK